MTRFSTFEITDVGVGTLTLCGLWGRIMFLRMDPTCILIFPWRKSSIVSSLLLLSNQGMLVGFENCLEGVKTKDVLQELP